MKKESNIKLIFREEGISEDIEVLPLHSGKVNFSYMVTNKKNNQRYFVKVNRRITSRWGSLRVEGWAHQYLNGRFPVPKLVGFYHRENLDFLITEYLDGERPQADNRLVARNAGRLLRKLHELHFEGYGDVDTNKNHGVFDTWSGYVTERIKKTIAEIPKNYQPFNIEKLVDTENYNYSKRGALLHLDFQKRNLLCRGTELVAVTDFERVIIGDPLLDLTPVHHSEGTFYNSLLHGYCESGSLSDVDKRKINCYSAILALEVYNLILREKGEIARGLREMIERRLS